MQANACRARVAVAFVRDSNAFSLCDNSNNIKRIFSFLSSHHICSRRLFTLAFGCVLGIYKLCTLCARVCGSYMGYGCMTGAGLHALTNL